MRIAFLVTRMDEFGGAQVHVRDLCLWLKRNDIEPVVLSGAIGRASDALIGQGVRVEIVPAMVRPIRPLQDIKAVSEVRTALRSIRPDVVSCHSSKAGLIGRIAARLERIPVCFTAHGWAFTPGVPAVQRCAYQFVEKLCGPLADRIITVSEFGRHQALKAGIAPAGKIVAIHNGMPFADMPVRTRENATPRVTMTARLAEPKDHSTLVAALARVQDLPWELHVVGGGDSSAVAKQCSDLGIQNRTTFHGELENVAQVLADTDVFVLLSRHEGFPRSILEAMRAGLPVIASNVGGIPESVLHGTTGLLVPVKDVDAAASALRQLLSDPGGRARMGLAARERYLEKFTFDHMAAPTLRIYEELVGKRTVTPAGTPLASG